ncbi:hypothetical protein L6452_14714 [Arctium lappa]|uniref:Uncharacterized protein n=1 Tax=Arctium lappa TaxID=4217 RepID=A0ACB9CLT2_ARCLA|nr:hypothetical protein L6452_14714 [Arctium lappa]
MFIKMTFDQVKGLYEKEMGKLQSNEKARVEFEKKAKERHDVNINQPFPESEEGTPTKEKAEIKEEETLAQKIKKIKRVKSIASKGPRSEERQKEEKKKEATIGQSQRILKRTKMMAKRKKIDKKPRVEEEKKVAEEEEAPKNEEKRVESQEVPQSSDVNMYMVVMDKIPKPITAEPVGFKPPEVIHWDIMKVDGKEYIRLKRNDEKYYVFSTWNKIARECSRSDLEEMFEVGMKLHADQLKAPGSGVYELAMDTFHMEYYLVVRVYNHTSLKLHAMLNKKLGCAPNSEMAKYLIQRTINQSMGLDSNIGLNQRKFWKHLKNLTSLSKSQVRGRLLGTEDVTKSLMLLVQIMKNTIFKSKSNECSNSSKAPQTSEDDIDDLFACANDFLNSDDGCIDERIDMFDSNAQLPDHSGFIINSEALPSVFEVGESSTKVGESVSVSTDYYEKELRKKRSEVRTEWRPKKKVGELTKSFSDSECNRISVSSTDLTRHMWYLDSGCSKHMIEQKDILSNYTEKYCGTVRFGNDQFSPILGYGDVIQDNVTIKKVSYVEGLGHNLFSIGQFCDKDLEVNFKAKRCSVHTEDGKKLLVGTRNSNLYAINLSKVKTDNELVMGNLVKGLPELKYVKEYLCAACEKGKMKRATHNPKPESSTSSPLELLHINLCGPMRTQSINGKKYVLVIVDNYSRYTWVKFLRSKEETPDAIIIFLKTTQVNLQKTVKLLRTDNGTEFKNKVFEDYLKSVGITHQFSAARMPEQNGVVDR